VTSSFIELHVLLILLHLGLVSLFEILGEDDVTILTDRQHSGFLAYCVDVSPADLVWPSNN